MGYGHLRRWERNRKNQIAMKAKDIIVGKRVIYYPILGSYENGIESIITHGVQEIGGTPCCWIDAVSSCVDIEHLISAE